MVDIVGSARVVVETVIDQQQAKKAGKKAGDAAADGVADGGDKAGKSFSGNFEGIVGKSLPLAAVGVGAAVGTVLAQQIGKNLEREATGAKLAASLGLTGEETADAAKASARIYNEAWGASFADVQKGVAATKSAFRDLNGEELTEAARSAQIFADIFETDVVQAAAVASVAVKQGLAKDAVEAFDLMTKAAQQVPIQFRDELFEAITEYSQFFNQIGIDGPEAFALLAEGAALGQYGIDKTGDAIKEFGIRAIDTSTSTADAFKALNLDIEEMQTALAGGGDEAEEAFRKIVQGLADIEDPAEQAQTAIALFGTPIEDLGNEKLPVFIEQLANAETGMKNYRGATKRAGEQSATFTTQISATGRYLDTKFGTILSNTSKAIGRLYDNWIKLPARLRGGGDDGPTFTDDGSGSGFFNQGPFNAKGTSNWRGGLTWVGEEGPELVNVPSGSQIYSNPDSRAMAGGVNITNIYNGPESAARGRREADWWAKHGTRFGAATTAGVPA